MNFNYFLDVVKNKYADFNGRARRQEYWMYILVYIILAIVASIIDSIIGMQILGSILGLALLVPSLAVGVRRLHDISKSGWFLLLGIVPIANFYLLYLLVQDGTPGSNEYGANPKEVSNI